MSTTRMSQTLISQDAIIAPLMSDGRVAAPDHRLVTQAAAREIYDRVRRLQHGGGRLVVAITASWIGYVRWARNRVSLASDERQINVTILRQNTTSAGWAETNQVDEAALAAAVQTAERKMVLGSDLGEPPYQGLRFSPVLLPYPETPIWSDATYQVTPEQRGALIRTLTEAAEARQLLSAGFIQMRVGETVSYGPPAVNTGRLPAAQEPPVGRGGERRARELGFVQHTEAQCSMTVRHPLGQGSGWAGLSGYDWAVIDAATLAQRALDKCVQSLNPVAIEPGRYTVILEPQAVAEFTNVLVESFHEREENEHIDKVWTYSHEVDPALGVRRTQVGQKMFDERITITHDPMDSQLGVLPALGLAPTTWVERGVLRGLTYSREEYALGQLNDNLPVLYTGSYRIAGEGKTMEELIASTKRGLVVSRLSNVRLLPGAELTLLMTGLTRDGLWLVEDGKISKAVKNMRFIDSPLYILNNVEQLGIPVPVFNPSRDRLRPVIVPAIKSRDFAFTATIDAV